MTKIPSIEDLRRELSPRRADGNKFDHGVALMLTGSYGMSGASVLSSLAALRSGLGMLHVLTVDDCIRVLSNTVWEAVLHSAKPEEFLAKTEELICEKSPNVIAIGPGLSCSELVTAFVRDFVSRSKIPIILDADGINAFRGQTQLLKTHQSELVITPHAGEFARLFPEHDMSSLEPREKLGILQKLAEEYQMTILYKGAPSLLAGPSGESFILPYGNSALAKAGSGDVLTGIITGLSAMKFASASLSQNSSNLDLGTISNFGKSLLTGSAMLGAYLHGTAGELASQDLGEYSVLARDLVDYLPKAFAALLA